MTIATFYPDADPETVTVDGQVYQQYDATTGGGWATARAAAGYGAVPSGVDTNVTLWSSSASGWQYLIRCGMLFDTSSIPSSATIDSAKISLYYVSKSNTLGVLSPAMHIVTFSPASNTDLVAADYAIANFGSSSLGNISYDSFVAGYNDITLSPADVVKAGITKLGARLACDLNDVEPTWVSNTMVQFKFYAADNGTNKPELIVDYTSGRWIFLIT